MRIRRRPPLCLPPINSSPTITALQPLTPAQTPDPTHYHSHQQNGSCGGKNGDEKLHPSEDPSLQGDNTTCDSNKLVACGGNSNDMDGIVEMVMKSEVKEEEDEEKLVDSVNRSWSDTHLQLQGVNSKKRVGSNALALEATAARLGETALPPRTRRGGCSYANSESSWKGRLKARTKASGNVSVNDQSVSDNDKCLNGVEVEPEPETKAESEVERASNGKKRRTPAVLMEGSRCSRVNGRGWRCCQQTLVGYSLCEHHLGKGRLRSMSSVRGQLGTSKPNGTAASLLSSFSSVVAPEEKLEQKNCETDHDNSVAENEVDDDELTAKKKRKKFATVKARSVTSLLNKSRQESTDLPQPAEVALLLLGGASSSNMNSETGNEVS